MKHFYFLVCVFFCITSSAHQIQGDPIIVWPTDMYHDPINPADVIGTWWGTDEKHFVEISITKNSRVGFLNFKVKGKSKLMAQGVLEVQKDSFIGEVNDVTSLVSVTALLYQNREGFHLRFGGGEQVMDFVLHSQDLR